MRGHRRHKRPLVFGRVINLSQFAGNFQLLALKFIHPGNPFSPRQIGSLSWDCILFKIEILYPRILSVLDKLEWLVTICLENYRQSLWGKVAGDMIGKVG